MTHALKELLAARASAVTPPVLHGPTLRSLADGQRTWPQRAAVAAAALAAASAAVLVLQVSEGPPSPKQVPATRPIPGASSESLFLGRWSVQAAGEPPGQTITFGPAGSIGGLNLKVPCGKVRGSWNSDGTQRLFDAIVEGADGGCFTRTRHGLTLKPVNWLTPAISYRVMGKDRALLNAAGATVAVLHPIAGAGSPEAAVYEQPAPLPEGVEAATSATLSGRWLPTDVRGTSAYLAFPRSGAWEGNDGCNRTGGGFRLGTRGRLIATSRGSSLVGCRGSLLGEAMSLASRAGIKNGDLVLYSADGKLISRATRP